MLHFGGERLQLFCGFQFNTECVVVDVTVCAPHFQNCFIKGFRYNNSQQFVWQNAGHHADWERGTECDWLEIVALYFVEVFNQGVLEKFVYSRTEVLVHIFVAERRKNLPQSCSFADDLTKVLW